MTFKELRQKKDDYLVTVCVFSDEHAYNFQAQWNGWLSDAPDYFDDYKVMYEAEPDEDDDVTPYTIILNSERK